MSLLRWGLIPSWANDPSVSAQMINARSETAATKPACRDPLANRRCLIPADGFYEWVRSGKTKQPYCFEVNDGELFAFAGLWDRWRDPSGQWIRSCSILTTTPNAVTSVVHDRMPVILDPDDYDLWLDPGMTNVEALSEMLKPFDARLMRCYPISTDINYVSNDDAACSPPSNSPRLRISYSHSRMTNDERMQRRSSLVTTVNAPTTEAAAAVRQSRIQAAVAMRSSVGCCRHPVLPPANLLEAK